ncbi:hypothetical protein KHA93_00355 [Bacillus sp. FJAT-49732]|uniref:Uncharacterized protein n=1 Tax=Lederbergia citrisecunda TaxID=2833583 RepID=A0A942YJH3_9BACI|nr:hypothetical protein [Lederbergia citrisecunda]MBS4198109.1 hypothetical protein [Lederbergia citrisecunda]
MLAIIFIFIIIVTMSSNPSISPLYSPPVLPLGFSTDKGLKEYWTKEKTGSTIGSSQ